jgi:hypothetical protein
VSNFKKLVIFVLLTSLSNLSFALEPADSKIKGALGDIERYEKQFVGKSNPRASNIKRALKLLNLTRQRLDSSSNKSHESWVIADQRYTALVGGLKSFLENSGNKTTQSTSSKSTTNSSSVSTSNSTTSTKAMISQDHVRVKKLARDIESALDTMNRAGVKPFQDPSHVKKFENASQKFNKSLSKYSAFAEDPGVKKAGKVLAEFDNMIRYGNQQAKATLAELGDVQAILKKLYSEIRSRPVPRTPSMPYSSEAINDWIDRASIVRSKAIMDYQRLQPIIDKAWLLNNVGTVEQGSNFDMKNATGMQRGLRGDVEKIDSSVKSLEANMAVQLEEVQRSLDWYASLDPADYNHRVNSFLGEGDESEALQKLNALLKTTEAVVTFDLRLKRQSLSQRQSFRGTVLAAINRYKEQRVQALQFARMPKSASTSKELLKIARKALKTKESGSGKVLRLVINSDKVEKESESSKIDIDEVDVSASGDLTMSGTQTTTRYNWQQFQVASAEPVGNKYYIFYYTLKYYLAGSTRTVLNQWLVKGRSQSSEILKENIDRD